MGHGLDLHWRTSAHVIEAMSGQRCADVDALIAAARAELALPVSSQSCAPGGYRGSRDGQAEALRERRCDRHPNRMNALSRRGTRVRP
jgi:hypothetical protein